MQQQTPVEACSEYGICWHGYANPPTFCQRELDGTVAQCPSPLMQQEQPQPAGEADRLA